MDTPNHFKYTLPPSFPLSQETKDGQIRRKEKLVLLNFSQHQFSSCFFFFFFLFFTLSLLRVSPSISREFSLSLFSVVPFLLAIEQWQDVCFQDFFAGLAEKRVLPLLSSLCKESQ